MQCPSCETLSKYCKLSQEHAQSVGGSLQLFLEQTVCLKITLTKKGCEECQQPLSVHSAVAHFSKKHLNVTIY